MSTHFLAPINRALCLLMGRYSPYASLLPHLMVLLYPTPRGKHALVVRISSETNLTSERINVVQSTQYLSKNGGQKKLY
jgi:hypothetical protein